MPGEKQTARGQMIQKKMCGVCFYNVFVFVGKVSRSRSMLRLPGKVVCSFVRLFVRSFVRSFICLFLALFRCFFVYLVSVLVGWLVGWLVCLFICCWCDEN